MYKVADFFCGGGGFSEGFKLAGFEIVFAVDRWQPAVTTHHANHPYANTRLDDVIRISNLPDEEFHKLVPDTEVIIGSPPCTSFSNSNKSGKADKSLGIQLIEAYLRIIARKKIKKGSKLKHWVLENVPNVVSYIKDKYTYRELGIDSEGVFQVKYPSSKVYNSKYFGVASNRKRYFCGDFPELKQLIKNDDDVISVNMALSTLKQPNFNLEEMVADPNFNDFKMKSSCITDHHYIMEVAKFEWKKAKRHKQDKGYMGRMSFPEDLNKPSRTVMATMSACSRESIIYPYIEEENRYRLPTVREIACVMSYPLDYRFYGSNKAAKYKLVGNSVPPKMSNAIAKSIARHNGLKVPLEYSPIEFADKPIEDFENLNGNEFQINVEKPKRETAKFKYHVPYLIINAFRVELTNRHSDFKNMNIRWDVEIHKSQGKNAKEFTPDVSFEPIDETHIDTIKEFIKKTKSELLQANRFQAVYCLTEEEREAKDLVGPEELLYKIKNFVDTTCEEKDYTKVISYNGIEKLPYVIYICYLIISELLNKINRKG